MSESQRELLADDALVLHVKNWQTADKYAVCFTKEHGKVRFIAYGARYEKKCTWQIAAALCQSAY